MALFKIVVWAIIFLTKIKEVIKITVFKENLQAFANALYNVYMTS